MKKLLLITLGFGLAASAFAQSLKKIDYTKIDETKASTISVAKPSKKVTSPKTSVLNVVVRPLGSASNLFTALSNEGNTLSASSAINTVNFLHRNNAAVTGSGGSGNYRYDLSSDNGLSFLINQGPVNPLNTPAGRFPQNVVYNPAGNTNFGNAYISYMGATLGGPGGGFGTLVTGARRLDGASNSEATGLNSQNAGVPTSLVEGKSGEFWAVDVTADDLSNVLLYKGVFNSGTNDVDWSIAQTFADSYVSPVDSLTKIANVNVGFSPTGQFGWVAVTGDLVGTTGGYNPIFYKSSDFGATWSSPIVVDLDQFQIVIDSLVDLGDTAGTGFDADLTVDVFGNPHYASIVGSGSGYSISNKRYTIFDISYNSASSVWESIFIDTVSTFRGDATPDQTQDNRVQVSRSTDGTKVFIGWSDTKFANQAAPFDNSFPDLYIKGIDVVSRLATSTTDVSGGTDVDGVVYFATFAPTTLSTATGGNKVPAVIAVPGASNAVAANFSYIDGIEFENSEFTFQLKTSSGFSSNLTNNLFVVSNNYPNPFSGKSEINVTLTKPSTVTTKIVNTLGQVVSERTYSNLAATTHILTLDATGLSSGVYFYTVNAGGFNVTNKMIVR